MSLENIQQAARIILPRRESTTSEVSSSLTRHDILAGAAAAGVLGLFLLAVPGCQESGATEDREHTENTEEREIQFHSSSVFFVFSVLSVAHCPRAGS
jgi:hypothetical protein